MKPGQSLIAGGMAMIFLWTLALTVSPALHLRFHSDAAQSEHSCAVTFVASGSYDHAPQMPQVSAPVAGNQLARLSPFTPRWVESPFLGARIFEHAPPAHS
jgi:hypothetical protein